MSKTLIDTETLPPFDVAVPPRGYRWWYLDASAADGRHHLIMIAFVGSVFSPFYARACDRGDADPNEFCAFNIGLYGPRSRHTWVFTEFLPADVERRADRFVLGGNALCWDGNRLAIDVDDRSAPLRVPVRGRIEATPDAMTRETIRFGAGGRHAWRPVAPAARIDVRFDTPALAWQGRGYIDTNFGDEPLHEGFEDWHWCRWHDDTVTRIQYRAAHAGGGTALDLTIDRDGNIHRATLPPAECLPTTGWRVAREWYPSAAGARVATIDDTPFYARSLLWPGAGAGAAPVMHESLALGRFRAGWVRRLLPFRMRFPLGRLLV